MYILCWLKGIIECSLQLAKFFIQFANMVPYIFIAFIFCNKYVILVNMVLDTVSDITIPYFQRLNIHQLVVYIFFPVFWMIFFHIHNVIRSLLPQHSKENITFACVTLPGKAISFFISLYIEHMHIPAHYGVIVFLHFFERLCYPVP